jgi:hypothetical protein
VVTDRGDAVRRDGHLDAERAAHRKRQRCRWTCREQPTGRRRQRLWNCRGRAAAERGDEQRAQQRADDDDQDEQAPKACDEGSA